MKKEKKCIMHIAFKHSANDNRIFRKECASLAKVDNYDVIYVTSDINSKEEYPIEYGVKRKIIKAYPKRVIRQIVYLFQIKKLIKQSGSISLVHLHEAPLLLIALWIQRKGIHVIFDSHEDYYRQIQLGHKNSFLYRVIAILYKVYEKHVCKRIDGVIFPCKMLEKDVFDYNVKSLTYIDNYPIVTKQDLSNAEKKVFNACYTGTISYERGVVNNIKAWGSANVHGILAGNFSSKQLEAQIRSMPEFRNVEYRGFCSPDELGEIYEEASVGMATLLDYGQYHKCCNLSTKVYEYMMFGIPTIIYRTKYVEEIMREYEFGIMVDPDNVDEIVGALNYLKKHPEEVRRMGENGMRAVREKFNWGTQEEKLINLYSNIL